MFYDNNVTLSDLNELEDVYDKIAIKNDITDKDIEEMRECILYFIDDFIESNIEMYMDKSFESNIYVSTEEMLYKSYNDYLLEHFNISELISECIDIYFSTNVKRSYKNTKINFKPNVKKIDNLLKSYENMEQPEQKTVEWYKFRWELLTASSIWKALDTQSNQNNLILSKCVPINMKKHSSVNINSPFHNGHKYEPLSTMLYEYDNNTIIGEFGCIRHPTISFLGASPDGINIKKDSLLYGRALEIKNPVNRELTGIPKKDYWVQMQLQMEVWDLEEVDFYETCFKEYDNEEQFNLDGDFSRTKMNKRKGIIIQFFNGTKPVYYYPPVDINKDEFDKWYNNCLDSNTELNWIKNIYWYLDDYSCVTVPRNKKWFNTVLPKFENIWNTIVKERKEGYEHRKPSKKRKKKSIEQKTVNIQDMNTLFKDTSMSPKIKQDNVVIKIRTQSFDELKKVN